MTRPLLFAMSCLFSSGLPAVGAAGDAPLGPDRLVGLLTEQYVRACAAGVESWTHPHFEAGFVWLLPAPGLDLRPLVGKPVVLQGEPAPRPPEAVEPDPRECPQVQARSDYVFAKDGVRLRRELPRGAATAEAFRVTKAVELTGLSAERVGHKFVVSFRNDLPFELTGLDLVVHYEGCGGKPGAPTARMPFQRVAPGKTVSHAFEDQMFETRTEASKWVPSGRLVHVPASIQLTATMPGVIFDLDLPVARFFPGAVVPCPDGSKRP